MEETVFTSTPFWSAMVAKGVAEVVEIGCEAVLPASELFAAYATLSGDMGPPVGDGNTHSLLPTLHFCIFRTLIASADRGRVR